MLEFLTNAELLAKLMERARDSLYPSHNAVGRPNDAMLARMAGYMVEDYHEMKAEGTIPIPATKLPSDIAREVKTLGDAFAEYEREVEGVRYAGETFAEVTTAAKPLDAVARDEILF